MDSQIEKAIRRYEATLAARESHPPRSKDDDLRMCRLCFVRKFTDGLGNTCGDCLHRVCANCSTQVIEGSGTSPTPKHRFVSPTSSCKFPRAEVTCKLSLNNSNSLQKIYRSIVVHIIVTGYVTPICRQVCQNGFPKEHRSPVNSAVRTAVLAYPSCLYH